jgi:hypothetical protein
VSTTHRHKKYIFSPDLLISSKNFPVKFRFKPENMNPQFRPETSPPLSVGVSVMSETGENGRNSIDVSTEYGRMDDNGNIEGKESIAEGDQRESTMKEKWLKVGSVLQAPIDVFTEKFAKPVVNHERFSEVDANLSEYTTPFRELGKAMQPAVDTMIDGTCLAAEAAGNGISYYGRRMSDTVLGHVNKDFQEPQVAANPTTDSPTNPGYLASNNASVWTKEHRPTAEVQSSEGPEVKPAQEVGNGVEASAERAGGEGDKLE